jgi:hypothetical protein
MVRNFVYVGLFSFMVQVGFSPVMAARPFATDDAGTVTQGTFELETGCDFWKDAAAAGIGLKHGVTDRMDVGIGFGYKPLPDAERGFEGAEIGLKFGLIPDLFALSASGSFGDKAYGINGILSKGFGPVGCDLNLGMTATADTNDADLTYGLCCHFDGEKFCAGAEIGGTHEGLDLWQAGCNFCLCDWCTVDAGINGNFEKEMTLSATAGLTFAFPVIKTDEKKGE